ncbi:MAG: winged helix-turn-helix domain-containing protein [Candidatus Nitrohelix vancouverensis]|uniref:Winged helix-turn-helix domain-containing protein n=1 Tax=Candidatus Nitrohelix vancouverensis TaxID=2705534 RepID=A0A7T0C3C0_9BACT|nr:MAG: winged helix-turn-helix domain-containing protein [Candidatus Nitrohelix vancouverensis]
MTDLISPGKLKHIALDRQGLLKRDTFGRGLNAVERAIRHLGYVQIDTISVVARAHTHTLLTRVSNFENSYLETLLKERKIFEYRFPVAAFRPIQDFRFTRLHARKFRSKQPRSKEVQSMMKRVLQRIRSEGPLRSRDFGDNAPKSSGWWDWKPAKCALEQLYFQGDLMISARDGFEKSYDLTERVLPSTVDTREPAIEEFASFLIDTTIRSHGFAAYTSFSSGGRYGMSLGNSVKAELKRRVESGELNCATTSAGTKIWIEPETLDQGTTLPSDTVQILSPFDNLVIQRERVREFFGFDYQIECYVPEAKRRYGYFCLPILRGDRFIGRMDCKAHREEARFEIKALFLEPDFSSQRTFSGLADPLASAIIDFARFDQCDNVLVTHCRPSFAKQRLVKALSNYL